MKKSDVIKHFGSVTKTAQALKITKAAVSNWKENVPYVQAVKIEQLTLGKFRAPSAWMPRGETTEG